MAEVRNIVILGASFAGLGTAHYVCKHILPKLSAVENVKYVLHIVSPSTHFWWNISAPRAIVSVEEIKHEKYFVPVMDGFKQYTDLQDSISFHHGTATAMDLKNRTVTVTLPNDEIEELNYYALIIATGVRSPTPLTTLHGDHTISTTALENMNVKLTTAQDVIIGGGGPVAVETAGEIGSRFQGRDAKVTLITGAEKLLPQLSQARATKAEGLLKKVGVTVRYSTKVSNSRDTEDGKVEVTLDDGTVLHCDAYIPAFGVVPNTEFLPAQLKSATAHVATTESTLRVDAAGPRVYAAGDVAGVDNGGVINMYTSLPVLGANLAHDLFEDAKVGKFSERKYAFKPHGTHVVPIGPKTGVGAVYGFGLPGFVVAFAKGKDYLGGNISEFSEGKKFTKA
jgi:NADH dehydrogenase FAD-containing subunit